MYQVIGDLKYADGVCYDVVFGMKAALIDAPLLGGTYDL